MKKPMIKALACSLAFTLALSTPVAVSAEGISSVYSATEGSENDTKTNTNTNTNTDTNSGSDVIDAEDYAKVIGIVLDTEEATVVVDKNVTLTATILIDNLATAGTEAFQSMSVNELAAAEDMIVVFEGKEITAADLVSKLNWSSDSDCATVLDNNDGTATVTGAKKGQAVVTAKLGEVYEASATVNVKQYSNADFFNLELPEKGYVKHVLDMNDYLKRDGNENITWRVYQVNKSGKQVKATTATITADGKLTLKKVTTDKTGPVYVTAVSERGLFAKDSIVIEAGNPVTSMTPAKKTITLPDITVTTPNPIADVKVELKTKESGVTTDIISWSSNKDNIATVAVDESDPTKAVITAVNPGTAKITAKATSGKKSVFTVKVKSPLTGIDAVIDGEGYTEGTIYSGQSIQLTADKAPDNATGKITYKIDNTLSTKKLATISANGLVKTTAGKTGTVVVTATAKVKGNKIEAVERYTLTVLPSTVTSINIVDVDGNNINNKTTKLYVNKAYNYDLALGGEGAVDEMVTWSTNKAKIASVDQEGLAKALKNGKATIKATSYNGNKKVTAKTKLEVIQPATKLELNKTDATVFPNAKKVQRVALNVKKQLPKGAKDVITWSLVGDYDKNVFSLSKTTGTKTNVVVAKTAVAGQSVVVKASTPAGVATYATVTVCNKTKNVEFVGAKTEMLVSDSQTFTIKVNAKEESALVDNNEEIVSVTANNKNVCIEENDGEYTVYALNSGKVKITAKTASGNKATLKLTINAE